MLLSASMPGSTDLRQLGLVDEIVEKPTAGASGSVQRRGEQRGLELGGSLKPAANASSVGVPAVVKMSLAPKKGGVDCF